MLPTSEFPSFNFHGQEVSRRHLTKEARVRSQAICDLWWTKRLWDRYFSRFVVLLLSLRFHNCSIRHNLTLKKQCLKVYTGRSLRYADPKGRSLAEIVGSNPAEVMDFFCYVVCCKSRYCKCVVRWGRSLCVELITRPEESWRLWCVVMRDLETSRTRKTWLHICILQL